MKARFWPILLRKSASVSTAEKYVPEIEICVFGRRFRTRISRSSVQKEVFSPINIRAFWVNRLFQQWPSSLRCHQDCERKRDELLVFVDGVQGTTYIVDDVSRAASLDPVGKSRMAASRASRFSLILYSREGRRSERGIANPLF